MEVTIVSRTIVDGCAVRMAFSTPARAWEYLRYEELPLDTTEVDTLTVDAWRPPSPISGRRQAVDWEERPPR